MIFTTVTFINLCILVTTKPYIEYSQYRIQLINEVTALFFWMSLQGYRKLLMKPENMYKYGWFSVAILIVFIATHFGINLINAIAEGINKCKQKYSKSIKEAKKTQATANKETKEPEIKEFKADFSLNDTTKNQLD
jgi:hypothetical protein